jgi:hypothetical protein
LTSQNKFCPVPKIPNQQPCDVDGKEDPDDVIFGRKSCRKIKPQKTQLQLRVD